MPGQPGDLFDYDAELRRYHEHLRASRRWTPRAGRALDQLRAAVAAHESGSGVWFDSRAWLIAARRP